MAKKGHSAWQRDESPTRPQREKRRQSFMVFLVKELHGGGSSLESLRVGSVGRKGLRAGEY